MSSIKCNTANIRELLNNEFSQTFPQLPTFAFMAGVIATNHIHAEMFAQSMLMKGTIKMHVYIFHGSTMSHEVTKTT